MTRWLSERRKAIAALIVPLAVFAATKWGLDMDDGMVAALTTIITGGVTYAVPNGDRRDLADDLARHPSDRGAIDVTGVLVVVILVLLIIFLVRRV